MKKTMMTIGVMALGVGAYMYMTNNKKKVKKYLSYLDNK